MWEYQREECSELRFKLGSSVFCHCGTPFVDRHRTVPCYHVLCSSCVLAVKQNNICVLCHGECQETQPIHPNEDLYVCTVQACNKGFLNFPSLRIHAKASHSIETHSIVDFYSKNGDTAVQLGEVHKIAQEHQMTDFDKEEFEEGAELEEKEGKHASQQSRHTALPQKPQGIRRESIDTEAYDDLEGLM